MFSNLLLKYYADDIPLNGVSVAGGKTVASRDDGTAQHELVMMEYADPSGQPIEVSVATPLPVTDAVAEAALLSIAAEDFATEATLALIKAKTDNLDIAISALRDALRGVSSKTLTDLDTDLATLHTDLGILTETAPATDTASSGLNGRLQRIAQRLTSLIALLPTSLGAGGGLKVDGSGTALPVTITGGGGGAVTIADGADVAEGAIADAIVSAGAAGTISAKLRRVTQGLEDLKTLLTTIDGGIPVALGQTTMANSMPVTIASDQSSLVVSVGAVDNTTLYSNNISATGAITGFLTTGYASVVIQLSNTWQGNLVVEGCNDDSLYTPLLVLNCNELSMVDVIYGNGNYQFKTTTKYVRLNVKAVAGTITALIVGRTVLGISGADTLSLAMDRGNNAPLYVSEIDSKKDLSKALIPSDAPASIYWAVFASGATTPVIDTTGYQSLIVQCTTIGSTVTMQTSNDGVTWVQLFGANMAAGTVVVGSISALGVYIFPATGKFVRGLGTGSSITVAVVYLRQQPASIAFTTTGAPINIQSIGGQSAVITQAGTATSIAAGTVSGLIGVGGGAQGNGSTTVNYPIIIGGREAPSDGAVSGKVRTLLTDTLGRAIVAGQISANQSTQNVSSVATMDQTQYEGMGIGDLLANILIELRINNAMMNELPQILNSDNGRFDDLAIYKNDFSSINQ